MIFPLKKANKNSQTIMILRNYFQYFSNFDQGNITAPACPDGQVAGSPFRLVKASKTA